MRSAFTNGQHSRIQANRKPDINKFGLDLEPDMLSAVTEAERHYRAWVVNSPEKTAPHATLPTTIKALP